MKVKVVGLGGIGTWLAPVLARYLASITTDEDPAELVLIDGDEFESANWQRQAFDQYGNKAEVTAERLRRDFTSLSIQGHPEYVTDENIVRLIREEDIVFLCVDNHATRKQVSDHCEDLDEVIVISGGNEYTDGSVHVYERRNGEDLTLPLANDFHPEIQDPPDANPADEGCEEQAESEPQLLITNHMAAAWMLAVFYRYLSRGTGYDELYFDIMTGQCRTFRRSATLVST